MTLLDVEEISGDSGTIAVGFVLKHLGEDTRENVNPGTGDSDE